MLKIHHVAYEVSDMDQSIEFYRDTLGLNFRFKMENPKDDEIFAFLEFDGGSLELLQIYDEENRKELYQKPEVRMPFAPHIAFSTGNMNRLVEELTSKGVKLVKGPLDNGEGVKWVYFSDPDDNIIEFIQGMSMEY